ncbi:MAG TPA: hypothetical protein DCY74_00245 [Clostridiales bacterium]|nr:hypothetical protein [Clostridiales bacterium]
MKLIIKNIRCPFLAQETPVINRVLREKGIFPLSPPVICKKSIDARKKPDIYFVYTVIARVEQYQGYDPNVSVYQEDDYPASLPRGTSPAGYRPVVVGFGPCGMFCALLLARKGYHPLVIEQGEDVDKRKKSVETYFSGGALHPHSNVGFGEGGAGAFSDGKLITRINENRASFVLSQLVSHGAPPDILTSARPHIGTDLLIQVVKNIREEIIALGGEIYFETKLLSLTSAVDGWRLGLGNGDTLASDGVFLAIGHSAHDTYRHLFEKGFSMVGKDFSVGMRIEHLQVDVDISLYGNALLLPGGAERLPKGEYSVSYRKGNRGVYSFCMCPGGVVVPASCHERAYVTNGMSYHKRNGINANAAIAVSVLKDEYGSSPLQALAYQEHMEKAAFALGGGVAPCQTLGDFLQGKTGSSFQTIRPTSPRGFVYGDLTTGFTSAQLSLFRKGFSKFKQQYSFFSNLSAPLTGYETKTSSPLRILRGEDYIALGQKGIYPCGEGAGYAGGITSAAVDGLREAESYMAVRAPCNKI